VDRQTAEEAFGDYRKTISVTGVPAREGIEQIINWTKPLRGRPEGRRPCPDVLGALVLQLSFL
jgi:hypothetical protein